MLSSQSILNIASYLNDLEEKQQEVGLACTISGLWMSIEQLVPGRASRIAVGREFHELQRIYSEKNIGGNRRTSGHGTFEKECELRGYPPRTVRGWIADYKAGLAGAPTEAQKRSARQQRKESAPPAPITDPAAPDITVSADVTNADHPKPRREIHKDDPAPKKPSNFPQAAVEDRPSDLEAMVNMICRPHPNEPEMRKRLAEFAIMIPLEIIEPAYRASLLCYDENWRAVRALKAAWSNVKGYYEEMEADAEKARNYRAQHHPEQLGGPKAPGTEELTTPEITMIPSTAVN